MPLLTNEISVGAVAYFDTALLNGDPRLIKPQYPANRASPFVCFQINGTDSAWAVITTQYRKERLEISKPWRQEGSIQWKTDDLYLNDGACTYTGPNQAFVDAAINETPFTTINRPQVTPDGIAAIINTVMSRNGPML